MALNDCAEGDVGVGRRGKPLPGLEGGFIFCKTSLLIVIFYLKFLFVVVYVIHIKGLSFLRRLTPKILTGHKAWS